MNLPGKGYDTLPDCLDESHDSPDSSQDGQESSGPPKAVPIALIVLLVSVTFWVAFILGTIAFIASIGVGHDIQLLPAEPEASSEPPTAPSRK